MNDGAVFGGNAGYIESVKRIVLKIHVDEQTAMKRPQEPLEKIKIGKAAQWIVKCAGEKGLNIEDYEHEVSNYFIRYVLKNHGGALPHNKSSRNECVPHNKNPARIILVPLENNGGTNGAGHERQTKNLWSNLPEVSAGGESN